MSSRHLAALLFPCAACLLTTASARADYESRRYTEPGSGQVLDYYLYVPEAYDSAKKYPLLVFLHAAGGALPRSLSKGWTTSFIDNGDDTTYPSFFLVPISQTNSSGWGDGRSDAEKFEGKLTVVVLQQLLASGEFNLDADRLYITGPSMGGRGTWDMIEKHPGFFAAAAPMAAPGLDDAAAVVSENIWAVNGENDDTVEQNRATIQAIRALGGNPIYTELADHGHDTWREVYPSDAFMEWMYAQRRGVPWWNVSSVPAVADPLTPGQPAVTGPTQSTGGTSSGGSAGAPGGIGASGMTGSAGGLAAAGASGGGAAPVLTGGASSAAGAPSLAADGASAGAGGISVAPALPASSNDTGCNVAAGSGGVPWSLALALTLSVHLRRRRRR
jgi:poly(3-hydroxybutyrate) depolymerase